MDEQAIAELNDFGPMLMAAGMIPVDAPLSENPSLECAIGAFWGAPGMRRRPSHLDGGSVQLVTW